MKTSVKDYCVMTYEIIDSVLAGKMISHKKHFVQSDNIQMVMVRDFVEYKKYNKSQIQEKYYEIKELKFGVVELLAQISNLEDDLVSAKKKLENLQDLSILDR